MTAGRHLLEGQVLRVSAWMWHHSFAKSANCCWDAPLIILVAGERDSLVRREARLARCIEYGREPVKDCWWIGSLQGYKTALHTQNRN